MLYSGGGGQAVQMYIGVAHVLKENKPKAITISEKTKSRCYFSIS